MVYGPRLCSKGQPQRFLASGPLRLGFATAASIIKRNCIRQPRCPYGHRWSYSIGHSTISCLNFLHPCDSVWVMNQFPSKRTRSFSRQLLLHVLTAGAFWIAYPPARAAQLTIGVIGDYGAAYAGGASLSNVQAVANLIKSWNPDFIITTGDNSYPNNEPSNIDTNIGQFFHEYIYP